MAMSWVRMSGARRLLGVVASAALVGAGLVVLGAMPAGAVACGPVDPNVADGDPGSLRDFLEDINGNNCDSVALQAGATYVLDDSAGDIDIWANMVIEGNGATIRQTVSGERVLQTASDLMLRNVTITGGREADGDDGGGLETGDGTIVIDGVTFVDNSSSDEGGAIETDGPTTVRSSSFLDNSAGADGGAIDADDPDFVIIASTLGRNCAEGDGGAIEHSASMLIVNSTISDNRAAFAGAIDMDSGDEDAALTLVYSDVVSNTQDGRTLCTNLATAVEAPATEPAPTGPATAGETTTTEASTPPAATSNELPEEVEPDDDADVTPQDAGDPSNINLDGSLSSFGSVVALPLLGSAEPGPAVNCSGDPAQTTSSGYNFSDDATCGFTGPTDKQSAGNPSLGALAANGGPTLTRLPLAGSPLDDAIPPASCGDGNTLAGFAVTTDQRGVARPQGAGCEIGSVEIQLVLSFTG